MSFRSAWWRLRHRKSRREVLSFSMGVSVGRALCELDADSIVSLQKKIKENP